MTKLFFDQPDEGETMRKAYDLHKQVWAVHSIPLGVDYNDSVWFTQFEEKFGYEAETVIKERTSNAQLIYVGPCTHVDGPLKDLLEDMDRS